MNVLKWQVGELDTAQQCLTRAEEMLRRSREEQGGGGEEGGAAEEPSAELTAKVTAELVRVQESLAQAPLVCKALLLLALVLAQFCLLFLSLLSS